MNKLVALATTRAPALVVAALLGFVAPAYAQDPVSVSKQAVGAEYGPENTQWTLTITGRADSVTIENVVVNRGNCKPGIRLPWTLRFGELVYAYVVCDPIELQFTTDQGLSTFKWDVTQDPVSVMKTQNGLWWLVVTSHSDSVTIKSVLVNRGNCKAQDFSGRLPQTLKFGQRHISTAICNPVEVQVITDQGSPTFTWNE